MRMKKTMRVKKSARSKKPTRFTGAIGAWAILLVVISVMGAAMLIAVGRPSHPADIATHPADIATADLHPEKAAPAQAQSKKAAASKAPAAAVVPAATVAADATDVNAPAMESAAKGSVLKPAPVTITGCLELDEETFRLKDTTGVNAPKARSWKSGFLKKGSRSIEVVDASNRLKLPNHVGQRVSVTGVLVDREMQVRSLQRVAASCK
jgi:hypothetical protein